MTREARPVSDLRLVFLDVDGVLCPPKSYAEASGCHAKPQPECIAALNEICTRTDARVVISSTWRFEGLMFMRQWLGDHGCKAHVLGVTCWPPMEHRGLEIADWLESWGGLRDIASYVILDDDSDMGDLRRRLVQTNGAHGLSMADAERAIALLTEPTA